MFLEGKKIILAITGSIAAYKTPQLVRLLVKAGAEVQVLMTNAAMDFVSALSLATVSKKEVYSSVQNGGQWNNHVSLGRWADVLLIAPCSANSLAKMTVGICDDIVQAVYLSAKCPVIIAPAMDEDMWLHPSTQTNVSMLQNYGHQFIPIEYGELASGIIGQGRMAQPEAIVAYLEHNISNDIATINGCSKKALVTAGPTYERIDPVRFIGNYSSGKMGIAIAKRLAEKGFEVDLILGPSSEKINHPKIKVERITSASEMFEICKKRFPEMDVAVMAAAVADFRPEEVATEKIKKGNDASFQIKFIKNPDILSELGKQKKEAQILVGFALETNNEIQNAHKKLISKKADFIVLNSLQDEGAGFGVSTNKVTILAKDGNRTELPLQSKDEIAKSIVHCILTDSHV